MKKTDLEKFNHDAIVHGKTYAEAQMEESRGMVYMRPVPKGYRPAGSKTGDRDD